MSDIAIHQLPAAAALSGAETVPVDDGTATVRTTVGAIRQGLAPAIHGHALTEVTGLQGALDAKAPLAALGTMGGQNANAVAITGGSLNGTAIGAAAPATAAVTTLTATGMASLGGVAGSEALRVSSGSYANRIRIEGRAASAGPILWAEGTGTSIPLEVRTKGTGSVYLIDGTNAVQVEMRPVANADRSLILSGSLNGDPTLTTSAGRIALGAVPALPSFTVATLPTATARGLAYVSDGASNRRLAVSDGTGWRWPDGAVVS